MYAVGIGSIVGRIGIGTEQSIDRIHAALKPCINLGAVFFQLYGLTVTADGQTDNDKQKNNICLGMILIYYFHWNSNAKKGLGDIRVNLSAGDTVIEPPPGSVTEGVTWIIVS